MKSSWRRVDGPFALGGLLDDAGGDVARSEIVRMALALFPMLAAMGCASEDAHFEVQSAPDFRSQGVSLSVFGVFRDGRMSVDAWDQLGPKLSPSFGNAMCDVAFGKRLLESN